MISLQTLPNLSSAICGWKSLLASKIITSEFTWLEMEKRACGLAGWKRLCDPHDGQGEHASREGGGLEQAPRVRAVHPFTLLPKITVLPLPFKLRAVAM